MKIWQKIEPLFLSLSFEMSIWHCQAMEIVNPITALRSFKKERFFRSRREMAHLLNFELWISLKRPLFPLNAPSTQKTYRIQFKRRREEKGDSYRSTAVSSKCQMALCLIERRPYWSFYKNHQFELLERIVTASRQLFVCRTGRMDGVKVMGEQRWGIAGY